MSLASRCDGYFNERTRTRGKNYHRQGKVRLAQRSEFAIRAEVAGSHGDYEVRIDWNDADLGELDVSCECPHFADGYLCKHVWAAILSMDDEGYGDAVPGSSSLEVFGDPDSESFDDDFETADDLLLSLVGKGGLSSGIQQAIKALTGGKKKKAPSKKKAKPPSRWLKQLSAIREQSRSGWTAGDILDDKRRQAWYVLDVSSSVVSGALDIELHFRETKANGEFGKPKSLDPTQISNDSFTDPEDRQLLTLLTVNDHSDVSSYNRSSYRYYGYDSSPSTISLSPSAFETVLPRLCATGRFVWLLDGSQPVDEGRAVVWDDGEPWRFRIAVASDNKKREWTLTGELVHDQHAEPVSLDVPVLLQSGGLVLFEDRLARLDAADCFAWIVQLRQDGKIRVPYDERQQLMEHLWQIPSLPKIDLPADLQCTTENVVPTGHLKVHPPKTSYNRNRLYADVAFEYEGRVVNASENSTGIVDTENGRVLLRNPEEELRLIRRLSDLGLRIENDRYGYDRQSEFYFPAKSLGRIVEELAREGWHVEAEGQRVKAAGEFRISVSSGVDWFDLDGEFDFDGTAVKLPDLLAAVRKGENYVKLGDGSKGLLPNDWLTQYGLLADLGEVTDGAIRFKPSQAMFLDALLAAQPQASVDRQFSNFRKKLSSFDGVSPRSEPRGFQGELRGYQKEGLGWLHFLRDFGLGGCLADDMGLGKTVQVLALLESRRVRKKDADGKRKPSLVIVPKSLVFNWVEEATRFTPKLRVLNYTGLDRKAAMESLDESDLLVTTYGTLRRDILKLREIDFDYAILDESQAIKNANSQAAKACRLVRADHRLSMTGTPVENHLGELWSLFEFLNPGMLGRSTTFKKFTKSTSSNGSDDVAHNRPLELLSRSLSPYILRRTKEQVLPDLPKKTEQTIHCEMEPAQRKQYDALRDYYRNSLTQKIESTGLAQSKIHVLEALLRLRQAACHPGLLDKKLIDKPSAKLDLLLEQIREVIDEGHKALIFSQFTSLLAIVRKKLDKQKITYEYLDGKTRKRQEKVERFQTDSDCPLFLISLKAGGQGLNLTAADYVYVLDPWWNPAAEAQAIDRAHRIGQERPVFAYRLICQDTVEERIVELQAHKRQLADAIITANGSLISDLTTEDLQLLLS